jgi:hypothetical protein
MPRSLTQSGCDHLASPFWLFRRPSISRASSAVFGSRGLNQAGLTISAGPLGTTAATRHLRGALGEDEVCGSPVVRISPTAAGSGTAKAAAESSTSKATAAEATAAKAAAKGAEAAGAKAITQASLGGSAICNRGREQQR